MVTRKRSTMRASTMGAACPPPGGPPEAQIVKVGLYLRVSTQLQVDGDSLEEQENELRKFCDYRNFHIYKLYIEEGKSGGNTNRPEYQKLMRDIEQHNIQAVVVKKLDRLSRSLLDFEQVMLLMQHHNIEFISLRENFDTTTAMGKAMLRMALVFAQLEREQTSERVLDVMTYRASLGHYNGGLVPFGYICTNKLLEISKSQKPTVELIFSLFLKSFSTAAVANHLNDAKLLGPVSTLWTNAGVERILKNPIYKGCIRWKGVTYPAQHQPLIAPSVWDTVQHIFESKRLYNTRNKTHALLQKLAHCGICDSALIPSFAYNNQKMKYTYYRCGSTLHGKHRRLAIQCTFKYVSTTTLHTQFTTALHHISSQAYLAQLDAKINTYNLEHTEAMHQISQHIVLADDNLKHIKAKKNEYVDILITKTFSTQDNQRIHDRMAELDKDYRQTQAQRATYQLEYSNHEGKILSTELLKQDILKILTLSEHEDTTAYRDYLHTVLEKITVTSDNLIFLFKSLPLPLEIPTDTS